MIAERLTAQLLAGAPARDPVDVAERLLAIQGQDPKGARLAVRARSSGLSAADVDRALTEDRSLLITWVNRGTLHLLRSEDYPWLHALTTPQLGTANARRLRQEGVEPRAAERAVKVIERALADDGPLTRTALKQRLDTAGVRTAGQALVHTLLLASLRGLIVRGPMVEHEHAYVLVADWLARSKPVDRDRALAELARRYLRGHGPAEDRDLAKWAGVTLRDARAGLSAIAAELHKREDGLVQLAKHMAVAKLPRPRLLGPFDPLLLGWRSREPLLGSHTNVVTINGIFRPIALVRGQAVGTWGMPGGEVEIQPFDTLSSRAAAALRADAKDVVRYLAAAPD